jgi:two-component sensor histidine kinase
VTVTLQFRQDARQRAPAAASAHRPSIEDAPREIPDHWDLLLQEADHRIKNSLSLVASMLRLQRSRLSDTAAMAALDDAAARIMAVADIHRALQAGQRTSLLPIAATLHLLCEQLGQMRPGVVIRCTADDALVIEATEAMPLNLAVNELLLNAVKHAYPPDEPGLITVDARRSGDGLLVTVADHGAGMSVARPPLRRLGQELVHSFCEQLGAELQFVSSPGQGTFASIRIPLQTANLPETPAL